jgi:hypothetical protein
MGEGGPPSPHPTVFVRSPALPSPAMGRGHTCSAPIARCHVTFSLTQIPISVTLLHSNLAQRRALSRCDPEGGASAVPAGGFAIRSRAVRVTSPPALRPGCQVPGLSAIDGAGNACILPFARSAAWTESWRSLAEASAAAERRKASGPPPYPPPHAGEEGDTRPASA